MTEIACEASRLFGAQQQAVGLLIDEVGFRKKGKMSACVERQYLGCIGKTENGQVAVAAGLSQDEHYAPIDMRLFMPSMGMPLTYLDRQRLSFIGDARSSFMLYFNRDMEEKCTVGKFVTNLLDDDFDLITIRNSTKGKLSAKFHYARSMC